MSSRMALRSAHHRIPALSATAVRTSSTTQTCTRAHWLAKNRHRLVNALANTAIPPPTVTTRTVNTATTTTTIPSTKAPYVTGEPVSSLEVVRPIFSAHSSPSSSSTAALVTAVVLSSLFTWQWSRSDANTNTSIACASAVTLGNAIGQADELAAEEARQSQSFSTANRPRNVMMHRMRSLRGRSLEDKYNVDWKTVLGEGAYGSVHPARLAATGEKVALKKISRRYTKATGFKTETEALLRIYDNGGHPNISGLRDMYEDHNFYYLILDLVTGGEMFEHLINYGAYSEADAARLMHEVASALAFIHGVGVVHADLKPENLLLSTKNRLDGTIKMIDFGCAVVYDVPDESIDVDVAARPRMKKALKSAVSTGTTAYWPPERFEKGRIVDAAMDMWAVGVILYIMLTGVHPFDVEGVSTDAEIEQRIKRNPNPPMDESLVGHLSQSAKDLILKLMAQNPQQRLAAYEMLHHPWIRGETALTEKIEDSDKKLSRFQDLRNKLEASMFSVLISQSYENARLSEAKVKTKKLEREDSAVNLLQRAFAVFDAEGKGFVTSDDLNRVTTERTGSALSPRDTKDFITSRGNNLPNELGLSLSGFSNLFSGLKQRHFPRGHIIFHAGDTGDAMYFLSSGKVEIQTRKGQLVAHLRSGDFFGEGSLLEKCSKRYTTAKCATPVDVIEIKREDFARYLGACESLKTDITVKWKARSLEYAKNLLRLQKNVKLRKYVKGQIVYKEGDLGTSMFRVHDQDGGELEVSHGDQVVHKYVAGDSFGESSLLFKRPRSSTVRCSSDVCHLHEMSGEDFLAVIESSPEMASIMRDMCRKRLFKKAVKKYALETTKGMSDDDLVAAFYDADVDKTGTLNLEEVTRLMRKMDPKFPTAEIQAILKFVDVDEDGNISLKEFKRLFRQFEDEVNTVANKAEKVEAGDSKPVANDTTEATADVRHELAGSTGRTVLD